MELQTQMTTARPNSPLAWFIAAAVLSLAPVAMAQPEPPEDGTPATPDNPTAKAPHKKKKDAAPADPAAQPGTPAAPADGTKPPVPGTSPGTPGAPGAPAATPPAPAPSGPSLLKPRGAGPWDHDLLVARLPATDPMKGPSMGMSSSVDTKVFDRGGVATLARDAKGRLVAAYQWFPQNNPNGFDKIAVRTSTDEGQTWSGPRTVTVTGLSSGAARPCDPTLVLTEDGRLRLFFTSHVPGAKAATYSAISPAADGQTFSLEPGVRFADPDHDVLDCATAKLGDTWHYFAPIEGLDDKGRAVAYHAVSKDGLNFERQPNITVDQPSTAGNDPKWLHHRWLGCAVASQDGKSLRFFGSMGNGQGPWCARSSNGTDWKLEAIPLKSGMDPAAVELKDGSTLVIATSPPRPGTPSVKRREGQP